MNIHLEFATESIDTAIDGLMRENWRYTKTFRNNPLVHLVQSLPAEDTQTKAALLDALQVWSDAFQRVIRTRVQYETVPLFQALAREHLEEERDHNLLLAQYRGPAGKALWEPSLAALCSWFVDQMSLLDGPGRTVLVHLVLEASGEIFMGAARPAFPTSAYFALHDEVDGEHTDQGYRVLDGMGEFNFSSLARVLAQGWQVMDALCTRIAAISTQATRGAMAGVQTH